jgi:hypothetical protein
MRHGRHGSGRTLFASGSLIWPSWTELSNPLAIRLIR